MSTNAKKEKVYPFLILTLILFSQISYSQKKDKLHKSLTSKDSAAILRNRENIFAQNNFSIQIKACALPKANIKTTEGYYHLNSKLHSSFSAGLNYTTNFNNIWVFYSGLHLNITRSNFYKNVPNSDLPGFSRVEDAPPLIYYKDIYTKLVLPAMIMCRFKFDKTGFWDIRAGINLNYSGYSQDENIGMSVSDTNNQQVPVFYAGYTSNNNQIPWISYSLGTSRNLYLKNNDLMIIELFLEYSNTPFLKCDYNITIPNKPITRGTYSVTGSCIGLSIEYTFTRANRVEKELKKKRFLPSNSVL